jgi:hypothetical protein
MILEHVGVQKKLNAYRLNIVVGLFQAKNVNLDKNRYNKIFSKCSFLIKIIEIKNKWENNYFSLIFYFDDFLLKSS